MQTQTKKVLLSTKAGLVKFIYSAEPDESGKPGLKKAPRSWRRTRFYCSNRR